MCAFSAIQYQRESQSTTFTSVAGAMMEDAPIFASHCLVHERATFARAVAVADPKCQRGIETEAPLPCAISTDLGGTGGADFEPIIEKGKVGLPEAAILRPYRAHIPVRG